MEPKFEWEAKYPLGITLNNYVCELGVETSPVDRALVQGILWHSRWGGGG